MAITDSQVAVHAAAVANPPAGAGGGTQAVIDDYAADFVTWLSGNGSSTNARAAITAAASAEAGIAATTKLASAYLTWLTASTYDADATRAALAAAAKAVGKGVALAEQVTDQAATVLEQMYTYIGVTSLAITPDAPSITHPTTQQFTATVTYADSTTRVVTSECTWTSSDLTNATIGSATGLATTVSTGPSTITADFNGVTDTTVLTVQ